MNGGYDPEVAPEPEVWLALDEAERCRRVEAWHRAGGEPLPEDLGVHVVLQTTVENQAAMGMSAVVAACERLRAEGLSRHEALHAVCGELMDYLQALSQDELAPAEGLARYEAALGRLNAAAWYAQIDDE